MLQRPGPESAWEDLARELDCWQAEGRAAALWWRDDDASDAIPALERLLALARDVGAPLAIAAVPAEATAELAAVLARAPGITVVQHGFQHRNHAASGAPAVECGGARPAAVVLEELRAGTIRLRALFASRFAPVLAPPWNRIEPQIADLLGQAGFRGLSTFGPRPSRQAAGLVQVNAHVDPLRWPGGACFRGTGKVLGQVVAELQRRRAGSASADEPLGLLTHHRDHDAATWAFVRELLAITAAHPAVRWIDTAEAFALSPAAVAHTGRGST